MSAYRGSNSLVSLTKKSLCVIPVVVGANEVVITSAEELLNNVEMGNIFRHTGTTGMNERSSRSHTILTLQVMLSCHNSKNSSFKSVRSSKLCLVDLAGSECARKTENTHTTERVCSYQHRPVCTVQRYPCTFKPKSKWAQ